MDVQLNYAAATQKSVNVAARTVEAVVSDETIDRMGDIIDCASWKLDRYRSNPTVLFAHKHDEPIGFARKIWTDGTQLHASIFFADTVRGNEVLKLFSEGALRAFSVGFRVGRVKDEVVGGRNVSRLLDCELMEISAVSVPANPNALVRHKHLGLVTARAMLDERRSGAEMLRHVRGNAAPRNGEDLLAYVNRTTRTPPEAA